MNNNPFLNIITPFKARELGLVSMCYPCNPKEYWILRNMIKDLVRSNIEYAVVKTDAGLEIWRTGNVYNRARLADSPKQIEYQHNYRLTHK